MTGVVEDTIALEFQSRTPWPADTKLYHPYEAKQILLSDFASTISVKAFLKMAQLPYQVELRANAEHMSPSGKVPFIKAGSIMVSELEPIVAFARAKGLNLCVNLNEEHKAEMKAYISLVKNSLVNSEEYLCWMDKEIFNTVTKLRFGHPYPWPLKVILPLKKKYEVSQQLKSIGWSEKTTEEVYGEIRTCCQALSEKLGDQQYFFGSKPTELDALVFGHLYTLITVCLPTNRASQIVCGFQNLVTFVRAIESSYFRESELDKVRLVVTDSE